MVMFAAMPTSDRGFAVDSWNVDAWNWDFLAPHPGQDTELLKQLNFISGLKELLMLRQVHALEHATVWVLGEQFPQFSAPQLTTSRDDGQLGGMATEQGFYLYGNVKTGELRRAVHTALQRITHGEWQLAVHPRCGTNWSVGMLLTAGLTVGVSLLLPRGPIEQLLGVGVAATTAIHLAPDVGNLAQRYLTTAIPFNLAIGDIIPLPSTQVTAQAAKLQTASLPGMKYPAHFVQVNWIERS